MIHWSRYLPGFCYIRIRGKSVERFVNLAMERNVKLWDIRRDEEGWTAAASIHSLQSLRHIAHQTGCYFVIEQEHGVPLFFRRLRRHKGIATLVLAIFFLLVLFSHSIVAVNVEGELPLGVHSEEILSIAAAHGIEPTPLPGTIDYKEASEAILRQIPSLSWVGFEKRGVTITISVVPRENAKPKLGTAGNIVATKDAYLRELLVFKGQQVIPIDQPIKAGDILISGIVRPEESDGSTAEGFSIRAEGIARGSVWYEASGYAGTVMTSPTPTGRQQAMFTATWDGTPYRLWGSDDHDYTDVETEEGKGLRLHLFGHELGGSWLVHREVKPEAVVLTEAEALEKAKEEAVTSIMVQIPPGAKIINRKFEVLPTSNGAIGVKLTIETYESLGKFVELE